MSVFQERTGISVSYTDDINDNAEFYAKVKNQLGGVRADQARHHRDDRLDGRPDDRPGLDPAAGRQQDARTCTRTSSPHCATKPWDPNQKYHAPWQSGLTGIAYNADKTDEVKQLHRAAHEAGPQGQDHAAHRDARHDGVHAPHGRGEPGEVHRRPVAERHRLAAQGGLRRAGARRSTATTTSTTWPSGNTLACEAWSGDVIIAQQDNPNLKFVAPGGGLVALGGQHARPEPGDATSRTPRSG